MLLFHRSAYAQRTAASDVVTASFVAALHTAGFWAVQHYAPEEEIIPVTPGMMFTLVMAEQKVAQPQAPVPPQPKQQPPKPKRAQLAAIARTPAVNTAPPPPVELPRPVAVSVPPVAPLPVTPPDVMAAYADNPLPQYPAISRRHGEEGKLLVRVCVKADGSVGSVTNIKSSGFARLDQAAAAALLQWRFRPARRGTEPVEGCVDVPWVWSLRT